MYSTCRLSTPVPSFFIWKIENKSFKINGFRLYGCNSWADFILLYRDLFIFVLMSERRVSRTNTAPREYFADGIFRPGTKVKWFHRNLFHIYFCMLCLFLWVSEACRCYSKRAIGYRSRFYSYLLNMGHIIWVPWSA